MSFVPPGSAANLRGAVDLSSLVNRAAAPTQGASVPSGAGGAPVIANSDAGATVALPSLVFDGTDANFNDFLDLSLTVPVIVELWSARLQSTASFSAALERIVGGFGGRLVMVRVDVDANAQLTQAFQAQSVPTVAAVLAGRPLSLFSGAIEDDQVRDVFEQVLQLAAQNGVRGSAAVESTTADSEGEGATEPVPEPLPPHHAEAFEAIERGDYSAAIAEYKAAIAQNPRDSMAVAGLAQVSLLDRLSGLSADDIRSAGADAPDDASAQALVADLDISGGHVDDAFGRILDLFARSDSASKELLRGRLLDYFEIVGVDDSRVTRARARLAALLY